MTIEQKRALALASARLRLQEQSPAERPAFEVEAEALSKETRVPRWLGGEPEASYAERVAAAPMTRFAVGAGSPALAVAQMVSSSADENARQLREMQQRGGAEGADVAGLVGSAVGPAPLGAGKVLPAARSYVGKLLQGAGLGAGFGAATPVTEGAADTFWGTKAAQTGIGAAAGGALSAAIPPVVSVAKGGYHALLEPWLQPAAIKGRAFLDAAGDKADEIIALLRQNKDIVPDSLPTAGEAAAPAGSAEFSALQQSASRVAPTAYEARRVAQDAARTASVKSVGQDRAALEAAEGVRAGNAATNYGAARQSVVKGDAALNMLLRRPSMDKAFARAAELAEENGRTFSIAAPKVPWQISQGQPPAPTAYPVESMHYIKMAMDDMLANPERFGIGASEARAIQGTQKMFVNWLETRAPAYKDARIAYAEDSEPVNQMQIGQYLEGVMTPAANPQGATLPANSKAYLEAVRKGTQATGSSEQAQRAAELVTKRSTGQPRFRELSEALTPQQMQAIESVAEDFARSAQFQHLARQGARAGPNAMDLATASMEQAVGGKVPNPLNRHVMVFNQILARLEGKINRKLAAEVAAEMLNPPKVAESLAQARARQMRNKMIASRVAQLGVSTTAAASQAAARSP